MSEPNPSRRAYRAGERKRARLAIEPVAFRGQVHNEHRIDARERMRPLAADLNYSRRTLAHESALDQLRHSTEPVNHSFPGYDFLGRRNPRMPRRQYA